MTLALIAVGMCLLCMSQDFIGAIIGAVVAAGSAASQANQQKKAAARGSGPRPKRRKVAGMQQALHSSLSQRQKAMIAMAQAHKEYAGQF